MNWKKENKIYQKYSEKIIDVGIKSGDLYAWVDKCGIFWVKQKSSKQQHKQCKKRSTLFHK